MIGMTDASMNIVNDEMDDGRWREEYFVFVLRCVSTLISDPTSAPILPWGCSPRLVFCIDGAFQSSAFILPTSSSLCFICISSAVVCFSFGHLGRYSALQAW